MTQIISWTGADQTSQINTALSTGDDVLLAEPQSYIISDTILFQFLGQKLFGIRPSASTLFIGSTFNISSTGVISCTTACIFQDIGLIFDQSSATGRDDLIPYPWAIDISNTPAVQLIRITICAAYNDIIGLSNCGASTFDDIKNGSFNIGLQIDGAEDSVHITKYKHWPFGVPGYLIETFLDGTTQAIIIGRCDGLYFGGGTEVIGAQVIFDDFGSGGTLNCSFNGLGLDGSNITVNSGNVQILGGYQSNSIEGAFLARISGENSRLLVSGFNACPNSGANASGLIQVSGSDGDYPVVKFVGCDFYSLDSGTPIAVINGGEVTFMGTVIDCGFATRTVAALQQNIGGRLTAIGCRGRDIGGGSGVFIALSDDNYHVVSNNIAPGWTYDLSAAPTNSITSPNR